MTGIWYRVFMLLETPLLCVTTNQILLRQTSLLYFFTCLVCGLLGSPSVFCPNRPINQIKIGLPDAKKGKGCCEKISDRGHADRNPNLNLADSILYPVCLIRKTCVDYSQNRPTKRPSRSESSTVRPPPCTASPPPPPAGPHMRTAV